MQSLHLILLVWKAIECQRYMEDSFRYITESPEWMSISRNRNAYKRDVIVVNTLMTLIHQCTNCSQFVILFTQFYGLVSAMLSTGLSSGWFAKIERNSNISRRPSSKLCIEKWVTGSALQKVGYPPKSCINNMTLFLLGDFGQFISWISPAHLHDLTVSGTIQLWELDKQQATVK